jgi:hypothetical protein
LQEEAKRLEQDQKRTLGDKDIERIAAGLSRENTYLIQNLFKGDPNVAQLTSAMSEINKLTANWDARDRLRFALELRVTLNGDNKDSIREWLSKAGGEAKSANNGSAEVQAISNRIRASVPGIPGAGLNDAFLGAGWGNLSAALGSSRVFDAFEGKQEAAGHLMNGFAEGLLPGKMFGNALSWGWSKLPMNWQTRLNPANYQFYLKPGLGSNFGNVGVRLRLRGSEGGAAVLQSRAQSLNNMRDLWSARNGTTSVVRVRNVETGEDQIWVATNGTQSIPDEWGGLATNEVFKQGPGHAEQTIVNALGTQWKIVEGGTSRNVCIGICQPLLENSGVTLGGPIFRGMADKTPYRMFWRP